ncbi:MAG: cation-translocating P-type ATPase [Eubacteriales bacterium]|nr:cation-translocating P-type ATPase [Eubacteriales bacterium]
MNPSTTSPRGRNVLEEKKPKTFLQSFLEQINDPLIYILLAAAAISILLKEYSDAAIIFTVILVNAVIGVIQEGKAQKALDALKTLTSPKAFVRRDGLPTEIPARDLEVGDIVYLEAGRQVPADLKLISAVSLKIEESALTGESIPVEKDTRRKNKAYMSTNVTYGRGEGIVTAIGMDTEIGKIARLINQSKEELTPLQKRLADLGKLLGILSLLLCALLFFLAICQHRDTFEMLLTAISLAVAAVPEGLPAIVTMVLALSVSRMVKVHTIVKRLPSVETLGCVSVVCSDKTGTLTQNRMTVETCYTAGRLCRVEELSPELDQCFLEGFTLCNDAVLASGNAEISRAAGNPGARESAHTVGNSGTREPTRAAGNPGARELARTAGNSDPRELARAAKAPGSVRLGDPTELALLDMAAKHHLTRPALEKRMPRTAELPFDSSRKMMTTFHRGPSGTVSYTKGSPGDLLAHSTHYYKDGNILPLTAAEKDRIRRIQKDLSSQALRLLALGMRTNVSAPTEQNLIFLGLVGMRDPVRPGARVTVQNLKKAGVDTIMITGDQPDTALAIAKELGIAARPEECLSGEDLSHMNDQALTLALRQARVFAHVSPEHKVRIVNLLKASGKIVAMTGDGVNDAPSLKAADVGIAMGLAGTDVAKNASDLILTDDNFSTIEKAIAEGRSIYGNIKKSILFLLSSNFGEIITMLAAVVLGFSAPLAPSHILWINLITDSLPALALGVDANDPQSFMNQPPRPKKESLFAGGGLACTLFYGFLIAFISIAAFLQLPIHMLRKSCLPITLSGLKMLLESPVILARSQTYAFTVLGISQLFHAIGMRDVEKSVFRMNHLANKMMLAAFAVGFLLQLLVTEVPSFIRAFDTCSLSLSQWGGLIFLASMPLAAHEILILLKKLLR